MIQLKELNKTFQQGGRTVEAVKNVTLQIDKGDVYGIIGFSGAGKSTLVRCINLLEPPTSGTVTVDGQELTSLSTQELRKARKNIGMIFQHFNLLSARTVAGNIAYPLKDSGRSKEEIDAKVQSLLELVDLKDQRDAYPSQLSGGQKQRVAIARALANDPQVLLCDEATSALDPQTTESILELLSSLNKRLGITIVMITHEMAVVKEICNKVAIMDQGEVVESGEMFKIFSDPEKELTKSFINTTSNLKKVYRLIEEDSPVVALKENEFLMRFTYTEESTSTPQVSMISREFNVDVNILYGDIEIIQGKTLGGLVVIMSGDRRDTEKAVCYLIEEEVRVEVLVDGRAVNNHS